MPHDFENSFEEEVAEDRYIQILAAINQVGTSLSSIKRDDPQLKNLIAKNSEAINNFNGVKVPDIKIETNQDKVIDELKNLIKVMVEAREADGNLMKIMEKRISLLETRPIPTKLKPKRGYDGTIEYMVIEYKK